MKKHALAHQTGGDGADGGFLDMPPMQQLPPLNTFHMPIRNYPPIPGPFAAIFPEIDKSHFNKLREFYFQSERLSAFQYVRNHELEKFNKS